VNCSPGAITRGASPELRAFVLAAIGLMRSIMGSRDVVVTRWSTAVGLLLRLVAADVYFAGFYSGAAVEV
jgi:hypothetical protein